MSKFFDNHEEHRIELNIYDILLDKEIETEEELGEIKYELQKIFEQAIDDYAFDYKIGYESEE